MVLVSETLNLLHVSSCKMFTLRDVLHETKQNKLSSVRSTDWKSSLISFQFIPLSRFQNASHKFQFHEVTSVLLDTLEKLF